MKLQSEDFVATTAIALGTGQLLLHMKDVYVSDKVESYNFPSVLTGITASSLWFYYQVRKGESYAAVYTIMGLVAQLYILQRLSSKSKERVKKEIHSRM